MRLTLVCLSLVLIASHSAQATAPPGYKLVFDEEFNGPFQISPGTGWGPMTPPLKWIAHTPYSGDFGDAYFTGPSEPNTPDPFSLANGILTVTAYQDPSINNHWRSGLISSIDQSGHGFSQALGYWETRLVLPQGQGVWPAFWLLGMECIQRATRTINEAEIDILEAYGENMTLAHQTVHVWAPNGSQPYTTNNTSKVVGMTTGWHVYGCLINTDLIHFYFDNVEIWNTPTPIEATRPLFVMIDLALGGGWPVDLTSPVHMEVDYVHVYAP
jgi:beta-glucanase (GH16 family)